MPRSPHRSLLPGAAVATALVLTAGVLAAPAGAATSKKKFDIDRIGYHQVMRAGAVETFTEIPRSLPEDVGYSRLALIKDIGEEQPRCEADGGAYWLSEEVEEAIIKGGAAPIAEGQTERDASLYDNPALSRTVRPARSSDGSEHSFSDRAPKVPANGNGPLWTSECSPDFFKGSATGDMVNASGLRIAGSTISGGVDKATGIYTATGRAYVTGLDGVFDTVSSLMQVTHAPAQEPRITYRLAFFNSDAGQSAFASDGVEFFGSAVPASELVEQFNTQSAAFSEQAAAVGPAGLQILSPSVYPDHVTGRMTITAAAAAGNVGLVSRAGTVGQNSGARFASVTWVGVSPDSP